MDKIKLPKIDSDMLSSLQNKFLSEIKNEKMFDEFIKENNITDEEIKNSASKFLKVKEDKQKCVNCKGKCHKTPEKIQMNLVFDTETRLVDIDFSTCDFFKKINALKKEYLRIDFPLSYLEYDYAKELTSNDFYKSRSQLIAKLNKILKENTSKGIFLKGNNKIGKSFIMALFSKKYLEKNNTKVAFCASDDIFKELMDLNFQDKDATRDLLNDLINIDLLVLDGFGNEYKSDFVRDNFVYPLLASRFEKNKLTMFTSNFSIKDITDMYSTNVASKPKAKQLSSLLSNMCEEVELNSYPFIF